jgi:hypothetical protein
LRIARNPAVALGAAIQLLFATGRAALAQGEISGRVTTSDSARAPVAGAEAVILRLQRSGVTDSLGRFRLKDLPSGVHTVVIRAVGFRAESSTVEILREDVLSLEVRLELADATKLPERLVTAAGERVPARLVEFVERQKFGIGHFINRDQLAKAEGGQRQTGEVIGLVPGIRAQHGGAKIWISSGRAPNTGKCVFCRVEPIHLNHADFLAGARPACYLDVYLDGILVFDSTRPENGLFDVNTIQPASIAGIEVYSSGVQVPAKYNRTGGGCGVLLIWTR